MKLNLGCGEFKLEGYINIDFEKSINCDIVCNFKTQSLPFKDEEVENITMMHVLEHIELKYWHPMFGEFRRVLQPEGTLVLAYPEFERCAYGFLNNVKGQRDFWRDTLYGRQLYHGDYHVVPMVTFEVIDHLKLHGFKDIMFCPEDQEPWNTFLNCIKGEVYMTRADVIRKEIFAK